VPFETYSYDLNQVLGGGFADDGMNMVAGGSASGKTTLAIDLVSRYMRKPGSGRVVVIARDLSAWNEAIQQKRIPSRVILSRTVPTIVGTERALTIAEVTVTGSNYYVGDQAFALAQVVVPGSCTVFLSPLISGMSPTSFNSITEMIVDGGTYYANVLKNCTGECKIIDVTRKAFMQDRSKDRSALDMLLDEDDLV
jgi:hypothetical protein